MVQARVPLSAAVVSVAVLVTALGLGHATASAGAPTVRFAVPDGVNQGACGPAAPCRLTAAVKAAQPGDEIIVEPGRYELGSTLELNKDVRLHGIPGPLAPVRVLYGNAGPAFDVSSSGADVSDLAIEALGGNSQALSLEAGTVERVRALSAVSNAATILVQGGILRDSLVVSQGGGPAVASRAVGTGTNLTPVVRGVTALGLAKGGDGIAAEADSQGSTDINVVNTIAHGEGADLLVDENKLKGASATVDTSHDDYVSQSGNGQLNDDGTSLHSAPSFLAPNAGDFRLAAKSPLIDAGTPTTDKSERDVSGNVRTAGQAPDIGAYEAGGPPLIQLGYFGTHGLGAETISAFVVPDGQASSYRVEFGPTSSYGKQTAARSSGSGMAPVLAPTTLTGLRPNTVYHYRFVASNASGTSFSPDAQFLTANTHRALAYTGTAKRTGRRSVRLVGSANPGGLASTVRFQWGSSRHYRHRTPARAIGGGDSDVPVGVTLKRLQPGRTYHFRVVAINNDGTTAGADATFKVPPTHRKKAAR
jgi:hypothetical protein